MRLRAKAFELLCYLLAHRERTVPKTELYAQVWPQAFISEATLESTLRTVRQAIGDSGHAQQLIQTIYGYGYRFIAAVEEFADFPVEIGDKTPDVRPDAVAAHPPEPSNAAPFTPAQGTAVKSEGREGGGGGTRRGRRRPSTPRRRGSGSWSRCCAPLQ